MKNLKSKVSLFLLLFVLCINSVSMGDWNPGDGHKMHFPQLPDIYGWNVNATAPLVLADDWRCSETGWVKDIHFWGSWLHEREGQIQSFVLSIHEDIPADPPLTPYSRPGNTLWEREIHTFDAVPIDPPAMQGWYDPNIGEFIFDDHSRFFQYNIFLPEQDWFWQEAGKIYWLNISAILQDTGDGTRWGWKSSIDHWNDDAVWGLWYDLDWKDMFEPNYPDAGVFYIGLDSAGGYMFGGGSGYISPVQPYPPSEPPWYYYENTNWWNQWYYDGVFDPKRDKVVRIIIDVEPVMTGPSYIEVAVNWSTPEWSLLGQPEPPLPPLTLIEEKMYIRRASVLSTPLPPVMQHYELDYVIRDYNPEWISVDVMGYNFQILNGIIEHTCVQSLDLAFVITGGENLDFGDAPDPTYPTFLASDGARHVIGGPWMDDGTGTDVPDSEPDGQPVPPAMGDDLDGNDDEDGLTIPTLTIGQSTTFPIIVGDTAGVGGIVEIWIDYDINGSWDAGELAYSAFLPVGLNMININVPASALPGMTFARGRISTAGTGSPTGQADDGEVEDTEVYIEEMLPELDFGDAPQDPYPTKLDKDGARHTVWPNIFLGATIDAEFDGQPNANATGDDLTGPVNDEDGVAFTTIMPGSSSTAYITPSVNGYINAWMDFNADGDWDDVGERIFMDYFVAGGLINACPFAVPFGASPNTQTFARFRYTTYVTAPPMSYTGQESDGEVEDYMVYITENPSIKWVQMPDTSPNGINIKVDDMRTIADDFECTSYGLITDVHLWGSWKYDIVGHIQSIHLSIHSDDPCGPGGSEPDNEYSKPDELLWERDFSMNEFSVGAEIYLEDGEYWWDPATSGELIPNGDHTVWRIDINIPENEAFLQDGSQDAPVIYWLDVRVYVDLSSGAEFGWKTRRYPEHYMDDAVFHYGSELPYIWDELRYPPGHPYESNSIDMAFVITGKEIKRPVPNLKWSQPPIEIDPSFDQPVYCGWNEESWTQDPFGPIPNRAAADDFPCLGSMPVKSIHWWGSCIGWDLEELPPLMPTSWNVKFYANVAAIPGGDPNYSHPGQLLWEINIPNNRVKTKFDGWDEYPQTGFEACFQHYVDLMPEEYFMQADYPDLTEDNIYWLGITAVYPSGVIVPHPWGWKTRPEHWMDDAVRYECRIVGWEIDPGTGELIPIIECKFWPIEDPIFGISMDLAFELDTDPNYIKWEQPYTGIRHWPHYDDRLSMAREFQTSGIKYIQRPDLTETGLDVLAGPLSIDETMQTVYETFLADDFICTQTGRITDIHLWVSYNEDIVMTDTPWFSLVIYENIPEDQSPTGYSIPGAPLWDAYLQPTSKSVYATADERFYDPNRGIIGPDTVVWRYDFDIDPSEAFVQHEGKIYWLGVHHSFDLNGDGIVNLMDLMLLKNVWPGVFGWKTSLDHFEDDAVWTPVLTFAGNPHVVPLGGWRELRYPIGHPYEGKSIDLAFEITTQEPSVNIIQKAADDWLCKRRTPITALAWWGSYIGYRYMTPCTGTMMPAPPVPPDHFVITIHRDVPADDPCNPWGFSHPGKKVWQYAAYEYDEVLVGYDKWPEDQIGPPREPVYRYSVKLPEDKWFRQRKYNEIYWISIMAVYKGNTEINHQGWGWTIHKHVFNDDAVIAIPLAAQEGWIFEEIYDQNEESADLSFTLFTDPTVCVTCPDYNWSDLVEFKDFAVFALDWFWTGPAGGYANGDLDCNGKVNAADLRIFCNQWLASCP